MIYGWHERYRSRSRKIEPLTGTADTAAGLIAGVSFRWRISVTSYYPAALIVRTLTRCTQDQRDYNFGRGRTGGLELTQREEEIIGLLRENSQDFSLSVTFKSGHWYVGLHAPQTSRQRSDGDGPTFSKAWDDIKPSLT